MKNAADNGRAFCLVLVNCFFWADGFHAILMKGVGPFHIDVQKEKSHDEAGRMGEAGSRRKKAAAFPGAEGCAAGFSPARSHQPAAV